MAMIDMDGSSQHGDSQPKLLESCWPHGAQSAVCNSFYIVCTFVLIRPIIVLFSYSALGCKSVLINQSIKNWLNFCNNDSTINIILMLLLSMTTFS